MEQVFLGMPSAKIEAFLRWKKQNDEDMAANEHGCLLLEDGTKLPLAGGDDVLSLIVLAIEDYEDDPNADEYGIKSIVLGQNMVGKDITPIAEAMANGGELYEKCTSLTLPPGEFEVLYLTFYYKDYEDYGIKELVFLDSPAKAKFWKYGNGNVKQYLDASLMAENNNLSRFVLKTLNIDEAEPFFAGMLGPLSEGHDNDGKTVTFVCKDGEARYVAVVPEYDGDGEYVEPHWQIHS